MQSTQIAERRRHVRLQVELPVQLKASSGKTCTTRCVSISVSGMQLICDTLDVQSCLPNPAVVTVAKPIRATVQFQPALRQQSADAISILSDIIKVVRLSESEYQFHIKFIDMSEDDLSVLKAFVQQLG